MTGALEFGASFPSKLGESCCALAVPPRLPPARDKDAVVMASAQSGNDLLITGGDEPGGKCDRTRSALSRPHPVSSTTSEPKEH